MQRLFAWTVSVFLLSMLFYGCLTPGGNESAFPYSDKFLHFSAYLTICFWHCLMFPKQRLWVMAACFSLGAFIELLQGYLGFRDASYLDQLANTMGCVTGLMIEKHSGFRLFRDEPAYN